MVDDAHCTVIDRRPCVLACLQTHGVRSPNVRYCVYCTVCTVHLLPTSACAHTLSLGEGRLGVNQSICVNNHASALSLYEKEGTPRKLSADKSSLPCSDMHDLTSGHHGLYIRLSRVHAWGRHLPEEVALRRCPDRDACPSAPVRFEKANPRARA